MDPYKSLLASASREHVRRSSAMQSPLVGNVFLPAIQSPKRRTADASATSPSAMSMQHLKVIEQCIQAENRREAQLAKCQSVRERRYWTRKFQVQREHERELIEALMIPSTELLELELLDLDADAEAPSVARVMNAMASSSSNNKRRGVDEEASVGGLTSSVASPDRVFRKVAASSTLTTTNAAKPHARKKFTLPECQGSPAKRAQRHHHAVDVGTMVDSVARTTTPSRDQRGSDGQASPPERRRSPSRSASLVRSGSMSSLSPKLTASPPKARVPSTSKRNLMESKPVDRDRHARATFKTRVPPLASLPKPQAPAASVKKSNGGRAPHLASRKQTGEEHEQFDSVTFFEGARRFAEAQRLALEAAGIQSAVEVKGEEKETQTSGRAEADGTARMTSQWASPVIEKRNFPSGGRPSESDDQVDTHEERTVRPHSSPPLRLSSSLGFNKDDDGGDQGSTEGVGVVEVSTSQMETALAAEVPEEATTIKLEAEKSVDAEMLPEGESTELEAEREVLSLRSGDEELYQEVDESECSTLFTRRMGENDELLVETHLADVDTESIMKPCEAMDEEELDGVDSGPMDNEDDADDGVQADEAVLTPQINEEELETDVAEVLFDLVDLVADAIDQGQQQQPDESIHSTDTTRTDDDKSVSAPPSPSPSTQSARSAALAAVIGPLVRVQALFRGHNTRRAFRLALYQEALRCGMLGAMPGTIQGASGWYQDPKSLVAYYFVVDAATGDWEQKRELHCRRLVLTPFDMRFELVSSGEEPIPIG